MDAISSGCLPILHGQNTQLALMSDTQNNSTVLFVLLLIKHSHDVYCEEEFLHKVRGKSHRNQLLQVISTCGYCSFHMTAGVIFYIYVVAQGNCGFGFFAVRLHN